MPSSGPLAVFLSRKWELRCWRESPPGGCQVGLRHRHEQKADGVRMVRVTGNLIQVHRDLELTVTSLRI